MRLNVPSDWNSQLPELKYYENTVWYSRIFNTSVNTGQRQFLHFGGVNYRCSVYLNGELLGKHEGGFTPFQLEVTDHLKPGKNFIAVKVNNTRTKDAIPALAYDWWNYGGITRDVFLVTTSHTYIRDYSVSLNKYRTDCIDVQIQLDGKGGNTPVNIEIPELKIKQHIKTDAEGHADISFKVKNIIRWSPENPKLYQVHISTPTDRISEEIGFRNLYVKGTEIYLNDQPFFSKGISFHEEIPQRQGRAFSQADAIMLLSEAKALGCNTIRLAHYPQNEYIVRTAEKMGFLLWEEIPMWQGIDFTNIQTLEKAKYMLTEMIDRDKNRCAIAFWGIANETQPSEARNNFLTQLIGCIRQIDTTRLIVAAFDLPVYNEKNETFEMDDPFTEKLDIVAVNKYIGWYMPWPTNPGKIKWNITPDKPLIISEFGGEALYGQSGDSTRIDSWSEEHQERLYRNNIIMFGNIANLCGTFPWILFDFRSPTRLHPKNQNGWNRKGLVSDQGFRKKAWYTIKEYYEQKK